MKRKLEGQIALITGASSGIGAGVAKALANEGASVVVNYSSSPDKAEKVKQEIETAGGHAIAIKADVSNEKEVVAMYSEVFRQFGTVDILVNNAGLQKDAKFHEMSLDEWNHVMDINLTGQFLCAREAIKEFLRRGVVPEISKAAGKIICMSSVHEVIPWAGHANYAASKGGVMMLMKSIAQEYAPMKIR
jgi:glucose 1-dehydrogenase